MGDIIPLNNGRSPMKRSGDLVTRKDVQEFVIGYVDGRVMEITEHYMQQIPGLVTHIATQLVAEMCKANGLEFKPPVAPTDSEKPE